MNYKRSVHLLWNNKSEELKAEETCNIREIEKVVANPVFNNESIFEHRKATLASDYEMKNHYYYGDNYDLLQVLAQRENVRKIDLIYIDPPYMTELDYYSRISVGNFSDTWHINRKAFQDTWAGGIDSYLDMLYTRLRLMRQALAENGTIFVHVDWHSSHYVKVLLDEVFGAENFINEIVWCFGGGSSSRKHFQRKHDLIFWYSRGSEYVFNQQYRPYSQGTMQRGLTAVKGDRYKLNDEGAVLQDWWVDINKILSPTARENLKFPTQKPKELISRIIKTASNPGSLVADFFAGSGTTAEVCNQLGRDWILSDTSKLALQTSLYRLLRSDSPPFTIVAGEENCLEENDQTILELKKPVFLQSDKDECLLEVGIEYYWPKQDERPSSGHDFASNIEFWELDLNYNGKFFNSCYQVIREKQRFKAPLALNLIVHVPLKTSYCIAVKVYDVYANQTVEVMTF
ncbi:MAG: site-specific DNA-methyltransferase [Syntrophomonas sp.]|nr:site-specific DNA-methyltransferase [Syntrophomonas sp.]